jgi:NAD(P)-dependent dehydrogenase (short-subunit alcohol dehydrogenase family)
VEDEFLGKKTDSPYPLEMANIRKTAIVTGGSQGNGAGLVKAFLGRGYKAGANSPKITTSGAFEASDKLALV